jgi:hypothetical protein
MPLGPFSSLSGPIAKGAIGRLKRATRAESRSQPAASKLAQAFQSVNLQESLLVQRLRARESQAVRQKTPRADPTEGPASEPVGEITSVDLPEPVTTDAQTFDRF